MIDLEHHQFSNITDIQKKLISMGFNIETVNKILNKFNPSNIDQAIEYLVRAEKANLSHSFTNKNTNESNLCDICNEQEKYHNTVESDTNGKKRHFKRRAKSDLDYKNEKSESRYDVNVDVANRFNSYSMEIINKDLNNQSHQSNTKGNNSFLRSKSESCDSYREEITITNPCIICLCEKGDINLLPCKENICRGCIKQYIITKIDLSDVEVINCPNHKCSVNYILKEDNITQLVDKFYVDKYKKFLFRINLSKNPNLILCPFPDCESYAYKEESAATEEQTIENRKETNAKPLDVKLITTRNSNDITSYNSKNFKCGNGHKFCGLCLGDIHPNLNCELKIEIEFNKYAEGERLRKCPQCSFFIKKLDGCNHLVCGNPLCKFEFCWICLMKYTPNHYNNTTEGCYGLQYANENNFFIRNRMARYFSCVAIILLRALVLVIVIIFPTFFIAVGAIITIARENRPERILRFRNDVSKAFFKIIYTSCIILLAIALIPLGYLIYIIGVASLPYVLLCYYAFLKMTRRRLEILQRIERAPVDEI